METGINPLSTSVAPSTSTFSFKAPFPASSSSSSAHGAVTASALKHRRVSLASQSSPRVVQAWSFRDDTGLDSQATASSSNGQLVPEKKGKMRKIDLSQVGDDSSRLEKKPRKKWTEEETQMLVEGCQTVSNLVIVNSDNKQCLQYSTASAIGRQFCKTLILSFMIALL